MVGRLVDNGPASETYAGFAWEHLRRNLGYGRHFERMPLNEIDLSSDGATQFRHETLQDKEAHKWGLECFESPKAEGLDALIFWRQEAFPGALTVQYHEGNALSLASNSFKLSNFNCQRQHYIKADGTRISVIKAVDFWLQISGRPSDIKCENQPFSVIIDGNKGARRRIDALRQLTSLSRDGVKNFKLLGRQKAFAKMRNALLSYDIRMNGGTYKDVAIALFGEARVAAEWNPAGCFLKGRAIRAFKFGERMVAQDYQSLLPKKTL